MIYKCRPERLSIYINSKRLTLDQIKAETGADIVLNGGLFNADFSACCHLKADGKLIASDQWTYFGYGWHKDKADLRMTSQYSDLDNYICCVCLVYQGKKQDLIYPSEMGGKRPRTMIGLYPSGEMLILCGDVYSPEGLQTFCLQLGLDSALMLDGGGSSQCITPTGAYRQTRKCANYILGWLKSSEPICPYPEPSVLIYKGSRGDGARWVQWMLNRNGAKLDVDGIIGGKSHAAIVTFQLSHKLVADGIVGALTRAALKSVSQPSEEDIISPAYVWAKTPAKRAATYYIVLHHAGVTSATAEAIHNYHKSLGWCGIGYNLYVTKDGKIYHGRPMDAVGAHTVGYNACSVGICFEGNFEEDIMPPAQIAAGKRAIAYTKSFYPNVTIKLHRELDATICPAKNFPVSEFR